MTMPPKLWPMNIKGRYLAPGSCTTNLSVGGQYLKGGNAYHLPSCVDGRKQLISTERPPLPRSISMPVRFIVECECSGGGNSSWK